MKDKNKIILIGFIVLFLAIGGILFYLYNKDNGITSNNNNNNNKVSNVSVESGDYDYDFSNYDTIDVDLSNENGVYKISKALIYHFTGSFNGYIEVESDYGYIPIFVTKHQLTFNGGLSGSIEGVE